MLGVGMLSDISGLQGMRSGTGVGDGNVCIHWHGSTAHACPLPAHHACASVRPHALSLISHAQVLFYIRLVGDVGGRLVPRRLQASRVRSLLLWAAVKTAMVRALLMSLMRGGVCALEILLRVHTNPVAR